MKSYNETILIIKEEKITGSLFCLRQGSSCGDGERFLFSVDWLNVKLLFRMLSKDQSEGSF